MPRKIREFLNEPEATEPMPRAKPMHGPSAPAASPEPLKPAQSFWRTALTLLLIAFGAIFVVGLLLGSLGVAGGGSCIARLQLQGEISYEGSSGLLGVQPGADELISEIHQANDDPKVSSILLEVNSPGGSAAASKELFEEIRASRKPVVSYLMDMAASGGYYAASASSYIVANPETMTANIGARANLLNYRDLFDKLGLKEEEIKSGNLKDIGSGYRNLTDQERGLLQALINEGAQNFVSDVREARGSKLNEMLFTQALDGRVMSASEALTTGLVDGIGVRRDAIRKAAELGKIAYNETAGEQPGFCSYAPRRGLLDLLTGASSNLGAQFASAFVAQLKQEKWQVQYQ